MPLSAAECRPSSLQVIDVPDSEFGEDGGSFYTGTINNTSGQHVQIYFEEDDVAYWFTKRTVASWMRYEAYGQIGKKADSKASGAASGADGGAKAATASSSGGAALDMDLDDFEIAEFETADQLHSASSPLVGAKAMAAATTTKAAAASPEAKGDAHDDAVEEQGAPAPAAEAFDGGNGGNGGDDGNDGNDVVAEAAPGGGKGGNGGHDGGKPGGAAPSRALSEARRIPAPTTALGAEAGDETRATAEGEAAATRPTTAPIGSEPRAGWASNLASNLDEACQVCGGSHDEHLMLLCDDCDKGYHTSCLTPPLLAVPEGEWLCPQCLERRDRLAELDAIRRERDAVRKVAASWT